MGVGFHINNPVPKDLIKECAKCTRVMEKFTKNEQEQIKYIIPPNILAKARGIAIVTIVKAGFLWSGRFGSGLVFAKVGENEWSAPSAISIGGMGVGGQIGAEITDFVFVLNTADAVAAFTLKGNVTIGGNLTITLGPVGRSAEAAGAIGKLAPIYAYSKSKGLFLGISLEGSVIIQRKGANKKFYGKKISAADILAGEVPKPVCADGLYRILNRLSKIPGEPYKVGEPGPAIERQLTPSPQPITTTPVVLPIRQSQKPPQLAPKPGPPLPPKSKVAIALYDFTGERSTDLSFKQGDLITIISKTDNTDDWWKGSLQNKIGDFPANYVELK